MYICSVSFFRFSDSAETKEHFLLLFSSIEFSQRISCSGDEKECLVLIPSLQLPRKHLSMTTVVSQFWQAG